jgi:hypothetical protein
MVVLPSDANKEVSAVAPSSELSLLESVKQEFAKPTGNVALTGEPGLVATRGNSLYQVAISGDAGYQLRRYTYPFKPDGKEVVPIWEQTLGIEPDGATKKRAPVIAVDPWSMAGIIAAVRERTDGVSLQLIWFEEMDSGVKVRASTSKPIANATYIGGLNVSHGTAVLLVGNEVIRITLRDSVLDLNVKLIDKYTSATSSFTPEAIVHFDGKRAMLRGLFYVSLAEEPLTDTDVVDVDTWETLARYRLLTAVTSVTEANGNWIVGSDEGLNVLAPKCGRP